MSNINAMITKLAGNDNFVSVPRLYIDLLGNLEEAALLSQLIYWSDKGKRSDGYIYKTAGEWEKEIALSYYKVDKITKKFAEMGFLERKKVMTNGSNTWHYKINTDKIIETTLKFLSCPDDPTSKISSSNLKNSKFTTSKISSSITDTIIDNTENTHGTPQKPNLNKQETNPAQAFKDKYSNQDIDELKIFGINGMNAPENQPSTIEDELRLLHWEPRLVAIRTALIVFIEATREVELHLALPKDKSSQRHWEKEIGIHTQNYHRDKLKDLYIAALKVAKGDEDNKGFTVGHPGALTKTLPTIDLNKSKFKMIL